MSGHMRIALLLALCVHGGLLLWAYLTPDVQPPKRRRVIDMEVVRRTPPPPAPAPEPAAREPEQREARPQPLPSSLRQIFATAGPVASVKLKAGLADLARSTNSAIDSYFINSLACEVPLTGSESDGTR